MVSPVAHAQPEELVPFELEMGIEQSDHVPDRNEPSVEDQLIQYELDHPEVVAEYEQQVVIAADKNAALPAPKSTLNKYKNYPAKSSDNFPVGVVTAWCHHSKSDERTEPRASRCPDYVNLWNKLRY
ncbi:hypothetical protein ACFPUZ_12290 [Corynebacterium nasicanis]|uniref:Uncharacterized protein n=1 Tax=Corynebacterium nasicanis TaxID=1448267 RepID=A0ABW1QFG5_9CORY